MNNFLLTCLTAVCTLTGTQVAADCCCLQEQFDGLYIGANLGALSHTASRQDYDGFLTDNAGWTDIDNSFTGGVQAGWSWQRGNRVLGLVADWNSARTGAQVNLSPNISTSSTYFKYDMKWFSTLRAKAGLAVCDAHVYVTAGAAVASFENTWHDTPDSFNSCKKRLGFTGGAGTEYVLCDNWTAGLEVLFMHFTSYDNTFNDFNDLWNFGYGDSSWTGRINVNYKFDLCSCW